MEGGCNVPPRLWKEMRGNVEALGRKAVVERNESGGMLSVFVPETSEGKGKNREERCAFVATAAAGAN